MDFGLELLQELDTSTQWPLTREQPAQDLIYRRRALLNSDKAALADVAGWASRQQQLFVGDSEREYVVDPMATLIAEGFADFLWGEDPEITAATGDDTPDDEMLGEIVSTNGLDAALWDAETVCVGEGEVWWHLYVDREVATVPLVEFASRAAVVPLMRGPRLMACAFVTIVRRDGETVFRCAEVHSEGTVRHAVWRGSPRELGKRLALEALDETAGLEEEWQHGLPMLAGRILNGRRALRGVGVSEYDRVLDLLLALNEARSIGSENARLTAKKRLFVNDALLKTSPDGTTRAFDAGDDVIIADSGGEMIGGGGGKPPISAVEYSFDAVPLIAHTQELERTILSRVRMVPQFVGSGDAGQAESGTAIRLRFLPTVNAANGKAREWDAKLPVVLQLAMLLDALPEDSGGFGRQYVNTERPSVERADILPRDETEAVQTAAVGVQGEVLSIETAVRDLHPEWDDNAVEEEVARIREDRGVAPAAPVDPPMPDGMQPDPVEEPADA